MCFYLEWLCRLVLDTALRHSVCGSRREVTLSASAEHKEEGKCSPNCMKRMYEQAYYFYFFCHYSCCFYPGKINDQYR